MTESTWPNEYVRNLVNMTKKFTPTNINKVNMTEKIYKLMQTLVILEVSIDRWGVHLYKDFATSLKKWSKELLLHCIYYDND